MLHLVQVSPPYLSGDLNWGSTHVLDVAEQGVAQNLRGQEIHVAADSVHQLGEGPQYVCLLGAQKSSGVSCSASSEQRSSSSPRLSATSTTG